MNAQPLNESEIETLRTGATGAGMLVAVSDRSFFDNFKEAGAMAKHLARQSPDLRARSGGRSPRAEAPASGLRHHRRNSRQERSRRCGQQRKCYRQRRPRSSTRTGRSCSTWSALSRPPPEAATKQKRPQSPKSGTRSVSRLGLMPARPTEGASDVSRYASFAAARCDRCRDRPKGSIRISLTFESRMGLPNAPSRGKGCSSGSGVSAMPGNDLTLFTRCSLV